jgi:hypothetical protein
MAEMTAVRRAAGLGDDSADPSSSVAATLHRLRQRGLTFILFGVLLVVGFVVAFIANDSRLADEQASGTATDAEVIEFTLGPPRVVKVRYSVVVNGKPSSEVNNVELDSFTEVYVPGETVTVNVHPGNARKATIIGVDEPSRFTSLPAAVLAVSAIIMLLYAVFEVQNAVRVQRLLRSGTWSTWTWRGVIDGPGRGRVQVAGYLSSPDMTTSHLLVNQRLCWRESFDLMNGKAVVLVLGDPSTALVVRHPAALRPAMLRPPKSEKERDRANKMLSAASISLPSRRRSWA